jgi:hypothetical protein
VIVDNGDVFGDSISRRGSIARIEHFRASRPLPQIRSTDEFQRPRRPIRRFDTHSVRCDRISLSRASIIHGNSPIGAAGPSDRHSCLSSPEFGVRRSGRFAACPRVRFFDHSLFVGPAPPVCGHGLASRSPVQQQVDGCEKICSPPRLGVVRNGARRHLAKRQKVAAKHKGRSAASVPRMRFCALEAREEALHDRARALTARKDGLHEREETLCRHSACWATDRYLRPICTTARSIAERKTGELNSASF